MTYKEAANIIYNEIQIDVRLCTNEQVDRYKEALNTAITALVEGSREHKRTDAMIGGMLRDIGIMPNLRGYTYLKSAIEMVLDDPESIHHVTRSIYPGIASQYGTTPTRVERGIRHVIDSMTSRIRADPGCAKKYFGTCVNYYMHGFTNSEFISMMAEVIREERGKDCQ